MADPDNGPLKELAAYLEERLTHLDRFAGCSPEEYVGDFERQILVERLLQTAIQAAIDMAFRRIALRGAERPGDYHESMDMLERSGVLTPDLAARMKTLIGLRNALVHVYRKLRHQDVYRHLQDDRETLRRFAAAVLLP